MNVMGSFKNIQLSAKHEVFVGTFEKKVIMNPMTPSLAQELKYIPLRKLMTALYLLSKDSKSNKAT